MAIVTLLFLEIPFLFAAEDLRAVAETYCNPGVLGWVETAGLEVVKSKVVLHE